MSLLHDLKTGKNFTEREETIRSYILNNPERIKNMSTRELGEATFSSPASISRFCKKLGCNSYSDFKIRFFGELKLTDLESQDDNLSISQRENVVTAISKITQISKKALEQTKKDINLEQMSRLGQWINQTEYIDFYAYDMNVHLANYGCNNLFYCRKTAHVYSATNLQELSALNSRGRDHLAIIISHTGRNSRLVEVLRTLKHNKVKTIVITTHIDSIMTREADEVLYTYGDAGNPLFEFESVMFSTSVKYLLDILFCMTFAGEYQDNCQLNKQYDEIGAKKLWSLLDCL
ncbi:MAG: MurR/RpiR family transcriptional regulator [Lachnospiraceae bacterium]|nr:MurR/RpiR family transcriptional regulator [Lachnospiraceae bacterium]